MNTFNTTSKTIRTMIVLSLLAFIGFFSTACGESEAYYALQNDQEDTTLMPENQVKDGKADSVLTETETANFDMSGQVLQFDTTDYDGVIVLDSTPTIEASFGEGASRVRHSNDLGGLMITWDGQDTEVWVRPRSFRTNIKGQWTQASVEVEESGTHRVSFRSDLQSDSYDVFFTNPEAMSFLLIETIAPAI